MYVVIAGGGMVGGTLARLLVEHRHDVVVVEKDRTVCEDISSHIGALTLQGTATDIDLLEEAGMNKAEVAIGAMPLDAHNLSSAIPDSSAGVQRIIVRMRNPRYQDAYKAAGVTRTLNIGELFVKQLVLEIEQPTLRQVATFGRGKASIVVATVPDGAKMGGRTVSEIAQHRKFPEDCVIAGIYRVAGEKFIFPRGGAEVRTGDQVFLAASTDTVRQAAELLQKTK